MTAQRPYFQRRHYQTIAGLIAQTRALPHDSAQEALDDIVEALVDRFRADNPKFSPAQFRNSAQARETAVCGGVL